MPSGYEEKALLNNEDNTKLKEINRNECLLKINKYKSSFIKRKHYKIQSHLEKLRDSQNKEIYIEKKFLEKNTGKETEDIKTLAIGENITLLQENLQCQLKFCSSGQKELS